MPVRLTDTAIAKASRDAVAGGRRDLADAGCAGLRLRVTPTGGKTWVLACRDRSGAMRRFPLGAYPDTGISAARDAARALHARVKHEGADPVAERRKERAIGSAARAGVGTLAAGLDLYGEKRASQQKAWGEARKRINLIFKALLPRPGGTLVAADFQMLADAYPSAASASFAVRSLRPALKWMAQRGYLPTEATAVHPPMPVKRRQRVLDRAELAALLPGLGRSPRPYAAALRFMLLTLARRDEVCSARWRDVDLAAGVWIIPATKNGQPHAVPLSRQAAALLAERRPADGRDAAANKAREAARVFGTASGGTLGNWDRETKAMMADTGTTGWTRHDLRRTGATMLGDMGEMPDIIEAALNHTSIRSPLAATYNRSRYRPQVAAALQRLADALDGIAAGGAEVVPLRSANGGAA